MYLYKCIYINGYIIPCIEMPYAVSCVGLYSTMGILKLKYHIKLNLKDLSS